MTSRNSPREVIFHRMTTSRYLLASILCLGGIVACRSSSLPEPETTPTPVTTPVQPPETRTSGSWTIPISQSTHSYHSTTRTIIQEAGSQNSRRDTIEVSTWFTITTNQPSANSTFATGSIDSVHSKPDLSIPVRPIHFTAGLNGGEIQLEEEIAGPAVDRCASPESQFLSEIRPLLIVRPIRFNATTIWTDSSSATGCSAGIPLTKQVTQAHRVGGEQIKSGSQVLELNQTEAIHFSGSGAQNQHQLTISGEGEGTTKLYIEIESGITTASDVAETINVSITSSGQVRRFIQQTQQSITLIR